MANISVPPLQTKYPVCEEYGKHTVFARNLGELMERFDIVHQKSETLMVDPERVICEMFGIDQQELERERCAMLEAL